MPETYDLYLTQWPLANAAAIGAGKPMIVVSSALLGTMEHDELRAVVAHECGHILSDHVLYTTVLLMLMQVGIGVMPFFAGVPLLAVRMALLEWSRAAELTSDRAAALATRDPLLIARTLMVLAGGRRSSQLNLDAFLRQGSEYEEWDSQWDRLTRFFTELRLTHGYPVRRVSELMKWVRSGEYDRIIGGSFPKRDDPLDPRSEAGDAYEHYQQRFKTMFREAAEGAAGVNERIQDWLKRR
jgi:Zn-dependent protease with chaperone function